MRNISITCFICLICIPTCISNSGGPPGVLEAGGEARGISSRPNDKTESQIFGAESNPTGNPIGGDAGYTGIVTRYDYRVSTGPELLDTLKKAGSGNIVYVADTVEINLTGEKDIVIPAGVTLASGRGRTLNNGTISKGGLIYTNQHNVYLHFLKAGGKGVRLTGLRLRGPDPELGDHDWYHEYHNSSGIESEYPSLEVDNCEVWGWAHAAILLLGSKDAYIHHNYIHHNRRCGLGYGIKHTKGAESLIEANKFDYNRHSIAGTREKNSFEARYNLVLQHAVSVPSPHCFDMHGGGDGRSAHGQPGGREIRIHHNTFRATNTHAVFIRGTPTKGAWIHNNWAFHDIDPANPDEIFQVFRQMTSYGELRYEKMEVFDNHYGKTQPPGTETRLPVAKASSSLRSGIAPLPVAFDGLKSSDPDGKIVSYHWNFGDGNTAKGVNVNHTFKEVGRYNVALTVDDNNGIPMRDMIPITVSPISGKHVLSFWVKDSYRGSLPGYYLKQAFIDENLIWQDDVSGDEGWVHVVKDITSFVAGKKEACLTLKVYCNNDVLKPERYGEWGDLCELFVNWDDVALLPGSVMNGDFESSGGWSYTEEGDWGSKKSTFLYPPKFDPEGGKIGILSGCSSGEVRSGKGSCRIAYQLSKPCYAGYWAQISQIVVLDLESRR
ncbi:PKD domain-containing protein [candidate division KSB1 bacterium]